MRLSVAEDIAWRQVAGETFIIDLKRRMMYGLNGPGGEVWRSLADGVEHRSLLGLLAEVAEQDDAAALQQSLDHFLGTLAELGLVHDGRSAGGLSPEMPPSGMSPSGMSPPGMPPPGMPPPECSFVPPQVTWSEEVRAFALSCLLLAGPCSDPGPPQEAT